MIYANAVMLITGDRIEDFLKDSFFHPNPFFDPTNLISVARFPYDEDVRNFLNYGLQAKEILMVEAERKSLMTRYISK